MNYSKIQNEIINFVEERDWNKFHSPKNLSMALSVEASELLEIFQWQMNEESSEKTISKAKDEIADIFYYLVRICQKMNIDLEEAFFEKMKKNMTKYPAEKFRGKSNFGL
ncbi:MAG: nucleotide pyrophosphohydrolase [Pelagibacteraceae bacterium]|nr:nucleotide pyrophosphohydrolase [Pelagibacteraceae bacterium]|tara:strand:+ start:151 stop:480 length:330 start_codon:yes stop_codon:yes gene_type:complete